VVRTTALNQGYKCGSPPHAVRSFNGEEYYLMCTKSTNCFLLTKQHTIWLDAELPPTPAAPGQCNAACVPSV